MSVLLNKKNICAKFSLICIGVISIILGIDLKYELMPFNVVFSILYVIFVLFVTIWISFMMIQHILNQNKPFQFDPKGRYVKMILRIKESFEQQKKKKNEVEEKEVVDVLSIDKRIELFAIDIERLFIRKWYTAYISEDESFLIETRNLLDMAVRRFLQISEQINSDKIMHGVLIILLKHVKEYRRTMKKVKNLGGSIEKHYRYSHIGSKSQKAFEYYTLQITTKLARHLVNWELYNSVACRTVIAIISKKLISYMLNYFSAPGYLNYKLVEKLSSKDNQNKICLNKFVFISISDVDHAQCSFEEASEDFKNDGIDGKIENIPKKVPNESDGDMIDFAGAMPEASTEGKEMMKDITVVENQSTTPSIAERLVTQAVKIHEPKQSNKTWRNSSDLDSISLGQDILYLSDMSEVDMQNLIDKKLWKNNSDSLEAEEAKPMPSLKESLQEDTDFITLEHPKTHTQQLQSNIPNFFRPATTGAATLITNTIKPLGNVTANTMKEFQQSTVNNVVKPVSQATTNAMNKIGDFQDEAAGVVEGIFDFGMAGLRKGLRLTGLQDNIQDTVQIISKLESSRRDIPKSSNKQKLAKAGHVLSDDINKLDEGKKEGSVEDNVWVNPLVKADSSPSFEGDILLEKSPVTSESRSFSSESKSCDVPSMEVITVVDSPDPEYEDTTDLATTTAKLRSLLAQKQTESAINTPTASPMSLVPTPIDPAGTSLEELAEVDGAIPSMYKTFAKTATGVFQNTLNTIKTALPGNANEQDTQFGTSKALGYELSGKQWIFVQTDSQPDDLSQHMEKFLAERSEFCKVDNAYEAIETIEVADHLDSPLLLTQRPFDDELDDFDTTIPMTKAFIDLICELVEDTYPPLVKEYIVKAILLTTGKFIEEKLHDTGVKLLKSINNFIGHLPSFQSDPLAMPMKIDVMVELCMDSTSGILMNFLNEDSVKSVLKLLLESLQSHNINLDTNLQLLDLILLEIISAASQTSPTYSA